MRDACLETLSGLEIPIEEVLSKIFAESRMSMIDREKNTFDRLAGKRGESLLLFGAGPLGRQTLAGLRKNGVEPLFFIDNRETLWGQRIDEVEVLAPAEAAARYGSTACFVVTIYNGSGPRRQLRDLGCECVLSYLPLLWKYSEEFVPSSCIGLAHAMWDYRKEIREAYSVLADNESRTVFCEQLLWRTGSIFEGLIPPSNSEDIYFPPDLITPLADEIFVDCGAFDGDSIRRFPGFQTGQFKTIYGLEPDVHNRKVLVAFRDSLAANKDRVTILPYAVGKHNEYVSFATGKKVSSHVLRGREDADVECVRLDDLFRDQHPTYLKMDIEGVEPEAIEGAAQILDNGHTVLAACLYHRWAHLWEIPLLIRALTPHHKIFMRRYAEDCWELVCYAIPKSREF